ncbi:MAG: hypothetical protein V3S51_08970 [Dehalococcoidia bacterium]
MPKRTITIESPQGNVLSAQIEAELVDEFIHTVTNKGNSFRRRDESFQHALESAVTAALAKLIEG